MDKPNETIFTASQLTASAGGVVTAAYTPAINGPILAIRGFGSNFTATGSLQFLESGTDLPILNFTSGTAQGNVAAKFGVRPAVYGFGPSAESGSPYLTLPPVVNGPIYVIGSGLGNGKSGAGISVLWG